MTSSSLAAEASNTSNASNTNLIDIDDQTPSQHGVQNLSISEEKDNQLEQSTLRDADSPPSYQTIIGDKQPTFKAADYVKDGKTHVLLAATGSLAVGTLPVIIERLLHERGVVIRIVLDRFAAKQLSIPDLCKMPKVEAVYVDNDAGQEDDPFLHIELRTWLDFALVAPCDASTLGKITSGTGDDLLNRILRAFDAEGKLNPPGRQGRFKYLAIAPAMDSVTWAHPITREQVSTLRNKWSHIKPFAGKGNTSWSTVIEPLHLNSAIFDCFEDNCNLDMSRILWEVRWQVDKFRIGHEWYRPGN